MKTKYYRNISYDPFKIKLYTLLQNKQKQYILTSAYAVIFESDSGKILMSLFSKKKPIQFDLSKIDKIIKNVLLMEDMDCIQFLYQKQIYGIIISSKNISDFSKLIIKAAVLKSDETQELKQRKLNKMNETNLEQSEEKNTNGKVYSQHMNQLNKSNHQENHNHLAVKFIKNQSKYTLKQLNLANHKQVNQNIKCVYMQYTQITVVASKFTISLYGVVNNQIKKVHWCNLRQQYINIKKLVQIPNSQYIIFICQSKRSSVILYDLEKGLYQQLNFKYKSNMDEEIFDIILSKEIYNQQVLFVTPFHLFKFNLTDFFHEKNTVALELIQKFYKSNCIKLKNHSLSGFAVLLENNTLQLFKSFTSKFPFYQISVQNMKQFQYSSKFILYWQQKTINLIILSSLDKYIKIQKKIELPIKHKDILKFELKDKPITNVQFTSNRNYVIAVIHSLLIIWKLDDILQEQNHYQIQSYQSTIADIHNISQQSFECLWVVLSNTQHLLYLK